MSLSLARHFVIPWVHRIGTPGFRRFLTTHGPSKAVKNLVDIIYVMSDTAQNIYRSKEKALREGDDAIKSQIGEGKDIISVMCTQSYRQQPISFH